MKTPHESALSHATGTAEYIDDRPPVKGEVYLEVVYSKRARARLKSVNSEKALAHPGVLAVFTARDLKHNRWGTIFTDQPFLAETEVQYVGEPIAIVAAESRETARGVRHLVDIEYEDLTPVLRLTEAIKKRNFIGPCRKIASGDVKGALKKAPHRLKGFIEMAGQDHFYLESQASIAYPKESGQIEIHSSSQHPTEVQHLVAEALGLKQHQVVCVVKRMGGAFGGKESQAAPFAVYAALAAQKLNRAARMVLTKDDDMIITGKRNPFQNHYEVGFDAKGRILALRAQLYSDGGAYADLSTAIMERAMLHLDNAYHIENFEVTGQVCKTNTASNTAFRGFGGPKGVLTIESILEDIAQALNMDALDVRKANVYKRGQKTPYGQKIEDSLLPELFARLEKGCHYRKRRAEILRHNGQELETWRGLSLTAVKFGISFTTRFLNQGSALVNLHQDGTFQVSTGATEMGQGVNTKIAQVVADEFSVPVSDVRIMPTSTEKTANTSATAASSGSDINGGAALNACKIIKENLARVAVQLFKRPTAQWGRAAAGAGTATELEISKSKEWKKIRFDRGHVYWAGQPRKKIQFSKLVEEAYLNRVSLCAHGFYCYPGIHFNKETGQGWPFFYFTNGVAATEVSLHRRTGELKVLRSDILMDLGRPINLGIDEGQVRGGFVQGMGWLTTENLFYKEGHLLSHSPSTYKIPSIHDIPRLWNVELLANPQNTRNVRASKAVGEPPLLLAISVWTAVKDALRSATRRPAHLAVPATQEQIFYILKEAGRGSPLPEPQPTL